MLAMIYVITVRKTTNRGWR